MSTSAFIGVVFAAYVCGLVGSIRGMIRDTEVPDQNPSKGNSFVIFLWIFIVLSYWPLEIAKIAIAVTSVYLLDGTGYALVGSTAICFVSGFLTMRYAPVVFGERKKPVNNDSGSHQDSDVTRLTERSLKAREKLITNLNEIFGEAAVIKLKDRVIQRFMVGIGKEMLYVVVVLNGSEWKHGEPNNFGGMPYADFLAAVPKEVDGLKVQVIARGLAESEIQ